jgi:hypothetical protein
MRVLIISEPSGALADALMKSGVSALVCVTQSDVHLRTAAGTSSGSALDLPELIDIDLPEIKTQLLKAYPLIDRWVGRKQSISSTLELMLEYTTALIQIIGNHPPRFAVLETGAPHHLFTYCLDAALKYQSVPAYYLYGNAFDGRCLVVEGNEKTAFVKLTDYSAQANIDVYIEQVQRNATYVPADSSKSLAPFLHNWRPYAIYLYLKQVAAKKYDVFKSAPSDSHSSKISLRLPYVGLLELIGILNAHRQYRRLIDLNGAFQASRIQADDIVYVGHMIPEATSFPECPDYPGEIDVLIDLKNRFPEAKIFYREHPAIALYAEFGHIHLQGLHKCPSFYRQLSRLGIDVIGPGMHLSKIRERGCLFATKTGRVAVENSMLGIPTLLYGFPFYGRNLPLAFHVNQLASKLSVQAIKTRAAKTSDSVEAVRAHLVDMFSGSIENPGIGLGSDEGVRPQFEASLVHLVQHLGAECAERQQTQGD